MGHNQLSNVVSMADRFALEEWNLQRPQVKLETIHHFAPGLYARELRVPAGTFVTGAVHRFPHLNILSQGTVRMLTNSGPVEISAPNHIVAPPGSKECGLALTDVTWTTIVHTELTDVQEIANHFVMTTQEEVQEWLSHSPPVPSLASPD